MKRCTYPYFHVTGMVSVFERVDYKPIVRVEVGGYIQTHDDCDSLIQRHAKYQLEALGLSNERLSELAFVEQEIVSIKACDAKGVRRNDSVKPDAFFDWGGIPKRDALIKQRRIVPQDHRDMVAIYGIKTAPADHVEPVSAVQP